MIYGDRRHRDVPVSARPDHQMQQGNRIPTTRYRNADMPRRIWRKGLGHGKQQFRVVALVKRPGFGHFGH